MAKKVLVPLFIALVALLLPPSFNRTPFELLVVDEDTGAGVPVRVIADNGLASVTSNGYLYLWSDSLMNRDVRFEIQDESKQFVNLVTTLQVAHGGKATLTVIRNRGGNR
jgi:hypothetical protein